MKRTITGVVAAGLMLSVGTANAEEDWSVFHVCANKHRKAVDLAEPSLHDGARLIVDVLCLEESTELGNELTRAPGRQEIVEERGFLGAFESFKAVMRREVTEMLFVTRKSRLRIE
jgi:hypothetical protein